MPDRGILPAGTVENQKDRFTTVQKWLYYGHIDEKCSFYPYKNTSYTVRNSEIPSVTVQNSS